MRALAHVVPAALRELLRTTPLSAGKVSFAWATAVGPALERATAVRLDGDLLLVDAATPEWTREIRRSSEAILGRLQALLGPTTVTRLEVRTNPSLAPRTSHPAPRT
jgi:hypothetical protein